MAEILQISRERPSDIKQELLHLTWKEENKIDRIAEISGINFQEYLANNQPYLNTSQIRELITEGFTIGSHSLNHPFFKDIDTGKQKRQIMDSFDYIDHHFEMNHRYFSFPFSDEAVSADLFDWLYNYANCQLSFGISGLKQDYSKYHLHRIPFEGDVGDAQNIVRSEYLYYMIKALFGRNRIRRS
ncbi:MAG: polysaccharide deacetylase family protein [Bacteroidota bacterium]